MMKTKSGFEFELDPAAMDNMELVEALADMEDNPAAMPRVLTLFLGMDQKKKLYEHVRDDSGRVSVTRVAAELTEIFQLASAETKKS